MIITKKWIHDHKTQAGAWNRKQLAAIGVRWPAVKGWIDVVDGHEISAGSRAVFESHAGEKAVPQQSLGSRVVALEMTIETLKTRLRVLEDLAMRS